MAWSPPRNRAPTLSDCLRGGLGVMRVKCLRCPREGRYDTRRLLDRYGDLTTYEFCQIVSATCPNKGSQIAVQACSVGCTDLAIIHEPSCYRCWPTGRPETEATKAKQRRR